MSRTTWRNLAPVNRDRWPQIGSQYRFNMSRPNLIELTSTSCLSELRLVGGVVMKEEMNEWLHWGKDLYYRSLIINAGV